MKIKAFLQALAGAVVFASMAPSASHAQGISEAAVVAICRDGYGDCVTAVRAYVASLTGTLDERNTALASLAAALGEISTTVSSAVRSNIVSGLQIIASAITDVGTREQVLALANTVAAGNPGGTTAASAS